MLVFAQIRRAADHDMTFPQGYEQPVFVFSCVL
jgi:hypothetical protein